MRFQSFALCMGMLCLLGAGKGARACDAGQRPAKVPDPVVPVNAASIAKIGVYKRGQAKVDPAQPPTIVGMWHTIYIYNGQTVDQGFETYRADGSEMVVALGPPSIGNVCNGTWEQTGTLVFKLTQPGWSFDESGNLLASAVTRDVVTIDRGGNKFSGTETVDVFDLNGRLVTHSEGVITGSRISPQ